MAKRDMDLYHSRRTQDDLKELIIKYKIPRDLHPRLPSEDFVMTEFLDDAIAGSLGFKQGYYFGGALLVFADRADGEHWKSGFFLIDQTTIPDYMTWRHPDLMIDDPKTVRLPFYCTPNAAVDSAILNPTLEELAVSNPSAKVIDKAEASQKRKSSTFGSALGHVAKHTRNQSGGSATPTSEGPNTQGHRGRGIMTDADAAAVLFVGASRPWIPFGPAPSFRELSRDAIHRDLFPFSSSPCYDTYPKGGEMVWIEALSSDQLIAKMSFLHCLMMSHGGELLAWYYGLLHSHHELNDKHSAFDASFAKSKAKGKERKKNIKSLTKSLDNMHAEVALLSGDLNRATVFEAEKMFLASDEFSRVQAELLSLVASAAFKCGLSMHRTKEEFYAVLNKISQFVPGAHDRLTEASLLVIQSYYALLNKISERDAEPLFVILQLEPDKLAHPANVLALRDACVSPPITKESTGVSQVIDDITELTGKGLERASFSHGDVVVVLSAGEKGDGFVPSSTIEEVAAPPSELGDIVLGWFGCFHLSPSVCREIVPIEQKDDDLKKKLAKNNEAKMVLYNALPEKEYERIFMCKTAKDIWKSLLITHQESMDCRFARFNIIITSLKVVDEGFSSKNYVRKFLRALHPKWSAKVTIIEESKDLSSLALDELIDNLKVHEVVMEKDSKIYRGKKERIKDQLNAKVEAVQIILTGIDNDMYSTVDACPNACEMWKAIERLKQ
nr:DUF4219 domain-containing protein/UBN2 domain-containing protein [Tanacetum cinerariifolium]